MPTTQPVPEEQFVPAPVRPEHPPSRLAGDPGHPWFDPFWSLRVTVFLNGIERTRVAVASEPDRYIEIFGDPFEIVDDKVVTVRLEGDVAIVPRDPL